MIRWLRSSLPKVFVAALSALWPVSLACACCCAGSAAGEGKCCDRSCCAAAQSEQCSDCQAGAAAAFGDGCVCEFEAGDHRERADLVPPAERAAAGGLLTAPAFVSRPAALSSGELAILNQGAFTRPARILYGVWRN